MQRTDLAEEAISALRATVDFSKTKLRKVEVGKKASDVLAENFHPSEVTNLLLQVKGMLYLSVLTCSIVCIY